MHNSSKMNTVIISYGRDIIKRTINGLRLLNPSLPKKHSKVIIKPNLVESMPKESGAVTRPEVVEGIIRFFDSKRYEIYIAEGAAVFDTMSCFRRAGYLYLEGKYKVRILDLHQGRFMKVKGRFWKEFEVSELFKDAYIVSAPVLKQHPYQVTLSLKNMMGILKPDRTYPVKEYMHKEDKREIWAERLLDLISHFKPHLAVIDATSGMFGSHLSGSLKIFNATIYK